MMDVIAALTATSAFDLSVLLHLLEEFLGGSPDHILRLIFSAALPAHSFHTLSL
jgi:hypothetical protein